MKSKWTGARILGATAALAAAAAVPSGMAQTVSADGTGNAVFVPYYTVNNGWDTLFNVTNTSANSVVVKVRFNEARNSRDVLDFNIALSPFDVWTAFVTQLPDGTPTIRTDDRSCTIPLTIRDGGPAPDPRNFTATAYSTPSRDFSGTNGDISRATEGYVSFLVMGEVSSIDDGQGGLTVPWVNPADGSLVQPGTSGAIPTFAYQAEHVGGEPRNCGAVDNAFLATTGNWAGPPNPIPGDQSSGNPNARIATAGGYRPIGTTAPLKVNASLVNVEPGAPNNGQGAGIESLHIAGYGVGQNLVTAQEDPWFLEPTLASGAGLWTIGGLNPIVSGIAAQQVQNEWTLLTGNGARAEWVVTFPTKRFTADEDALNVQAGCSIYRNAATAPGNPVVPQGSAGPAWPGFSAPGNVPTSLAVADCAMQDFPSVFQDGNDGLAPLDVLFTIFDREENTFQRQVAVSPNPQGLDNLPFEVNVLRIGPAGQLGPSVLDSQEPVAQTVDTTPLLPALNGWMALSFLQPDTDTGELVLNETGNAVTGFLFKSRNFGDPTLSFGQATPHGFLRAAD